MDELRRRKFQIRNLAASDLPATGLALPRSANFPAHRLPPDDVDVIISQLLPKTHSLLHWNSNTHEAPRMTTISAPMASLNLYLVTFNCARQLIDPEAFASSLFSALPKDASLPDLLVLSLQEVAPIAYSFAGASFLASYLQEFHRAVQIAALKRGRAETRYVEVARKNVGMTAVLAFAREDRQDEVRSVSMAEVGVGAWEMGNKGAAGVRLGYHTEDGRGNVSLTFVGAHLAPMEDAVERRNDDWKSIVQRLVFIDQEPDSSQPEPAADGEAEPLLTSTTDKTTWHTLYTGTDHVFVMGDLNYRTNSKKPTPEQARTFPQPTRDSKDPQHYLHLLAEDQLTRERTAGRTLHGFREASIAFPPTYKYSTKDASSDAKGWAWASHRWPSWCDRIPYLDVPGLDHQLQVHAYSALPLMPSSDHRPVALAVTVPVVPVDVAGLPDDSPRVRPPFEIDPWWRERRARARAEEICVGVLAYLGLTRQGNGILLALLAGSWGTWLLVQSLTRN